MTPRLAATSKRVAWSSSCGSCTASSQPGHSGLLPVRERLIPKRDGRYRRLGIPALRDRVVQMALKLVMEPIFEIDFYPSSYAYRPGRRAQDAIAEIHHLTKAPSSYEWVVETDIEACFDRLPHCLIGDEVRRRIGDKRVLLLVRSSPRRA